MDGELIARGPFERGSGFSALNTSAMWIPKQAPSYVCPHITGIVGAWANGSRFAVPAHDVDTYLTPQINVNDAQDPGIIKGPVATP